MKYICILNFIENHFLTFLLQFNSRERWPVRPADQTHPFGGLDPDFFPSIQLSESRLGASVSFITFGEVVTWKFSYNFIVVIGFLIHESRVDRITGKWRHAPRKEVETGWWRCELMVGIVIGVRCVDHLNIIWYRAARLQIQSIRIHSCSESNLNWNFKQTTVICKTKND